MKREILADKKAQGTQIVGAIAAVALIAAMLIVMILITRKVLFGG